MQWLPIDSAPKDGTEIDVWVTNQHGMDGYRHTYVKWDSGAWRFYSHILHRWMKVEVEFGAKVTHWMPLPEPPQSDA